MEIQTTINSRHTALVEPNEALAVSVAPPCDAIIFIPGFSKTDEDQAVEDFARRLAVALDRGASNVGLLFGVSEVRAERFDPSGKTRVCRIARDDGAGQVPKVDVYGLQYRELLAGRFASMSLLGKSFALLRALFGALPRFVAALWRPGKTSMEKVQIALSLAILFVLSLYVGIVLLGVIDLARGTLQSAAAVAPGALQIEPRLVQAQPGQGNLFDQIGQLFAWAWGWLQWLNPFNASAAQLALILTAIGLFIPSRVQLRQFIEQTATAYVALILYLNSGERRNVALGQLRNLLEYVARQQPHYRNIHVVAYSFGTIVAIDSLFPDLLPPSQRIGRIASLTTIGCPFDFIRTFWPNYFDGRRAHSDTLAREHFWYNIYSPDDVFGSNFRNDSKIDVADYAINRPMDQLDGLPPERAAMRVRLPGALGLSQALQRWIDALVGGRAPVVLDDLVGAAYKPDAASERPLMPTNIPWIIRNGRRQLSWFDAFTLMGVRAHSLYWEEANEPQLNCFDPFVAQLYDDTFLSG